MKKRMLGAVGVVAGIAMLAGTYFANIGKNEIADMPVKDTTTSSENTVFCLANEQEMKDYMNDNSKHTVLIDARSQDSYAGWAVDGDKRGGHLRNAINFSTQWLSGDFGYSEDEIQKILDTNEMTEEKAYTIYDTNGEDAKIVAEYLMQEKGYQKICIYNADEMINQQNTDLETYKNYSLYIPAEIVKNVSDHIMKGEDLSPEAKQAADGKNLIILEVSRGKKGGKKGHVPGAVPVNMDDFETAATDGKQIQEEYTAGYRLKSDKELIKAAGKAGIRKDDCVILTGEEPMIATRLGVILKYLGVSKVHVMNQGMLGWNAKGYELEIGSREMQSVAFGAEKPQNPEVIDTMDEMIKKRKDSGYQVVDTRTEEEWNGVQSGYESSVLKGRITGTVHAPAGIKTSDSLWYYRNPDQSLRNQVEIASMWKENGVMAEKKLVFFDGDGYRASEILWDAWVLGYDGSLYSNGWLEWSASGRLFMGEDGKMYRYDKNRKEVVKAE